MPAFAKTRSQTRRRPRAAKVAPTRRRAPPSAALINAVLEYADLRDDMGGGRVMLRLSPEAIDDAAVLASLGAEAERICDVAVIWDEREDEIVRVLDGGPPPLAVVPPVDEEGRFVLTPAAHAYIAAHARG